MGAQGIGDAGHPRQRTDSDTPVPGGVDSPVDDGGTVHGVLHAPCAGGVGERGHGIVPTGLDQGQGRAQGGPRRVLGYTWNLGLACTLDAVDGIGSHHVGRGDVQRVAVPGRGRTQRRRRPLLLPQGGGRRQGRLVARQHLPQQLTGGLRVQHLGADHAVGITIAGGLQVQVVAGLASAQHRVQLLAGLLPGGQAVHGVDRHALGRVDGGGVPQLGV